MAKENKTYSNDPQASKKGKGAKIRKNEKGIDKFIDFTKKVMLPAMVVPALISGAMVAGTRLGNKKVYSNRKDYQQPRKVDMGKIRKPNLFD